MPRPQHPRWAAGAKSRPNDAGFNVEGYDLYSNHPGMDCTAVMPDGTTGEIGVWVRSDSSRRFALAEYGLTVPLPSGQSLTLGAGEVSVVKVDRWGPDAADPLVGLFERNGQVADATCRFGEPNFPYQGTVDLAFKVGPDWPTRDELLAWCVANLAPEVVDALCPYRVALPAA